MEGSFRADIRDVSDISDVSDARKTASVLSIISLHRKMRKNGGRKFVIIYHIPSAVDG